MRYAERALCPACESGKLEVYRQDENFVYKQREKIMEVCGYRCDRCGEVFFEEREERRIEKALTDFRRETEGLLTSDEIRRIRRRFGKSQIEFARLLGVGKKNFARYETGQATQSRAVDDLLRILDAYPMAIEVLEKRRKASTTVFYRRTIMIRSEKIIEFPVNYSGLQEGAGWEDFSDNASSF